MREGKSISKVLVVVGLIGISSLIGVTLAQESVDSAAWPPADDPSVLNAQTMVNANKALVNAIADGKDRAIAVGERGHIFTSASRRDWEQVANVPTRSNLTAVDAIDNFAWAVGHDGVILHSSDGGLTWARQRVSPWNPDDDNIRNGVPLLDVMFVSATEGFAVGAYALLLHTVDGGKNWERVAITASEDELAADDAEAAPMGEGELFEATDLAIEEESDPHLNAITRTGDGSMLIVAERGTAFRSIDAGRTWSRIKMPYDGSMFGLIGYEGQHVLAFGLRGNVYESYDLGNNWQKIETGTTLSLMGGVGEADGGAVIVGANGVVLTRANANEPFATSSTPESSVLATVLATAEGGEIVLGGENGFAIFQPNPQSQQTAPAP